MKLFIAGHNGMVGAALMRRYQNQAGVEIITRSRQELDLMDQRAVFDFYAGQRPDAVIIAAGKVGGIHANNTYPAEFLYDNLAIAMNCIEGARRVGVKRLLNLGSSCIYPRHASQPMAEECMLTGPLEPTNEGYAIAKIAGVKMAQFYRHQYGVLFYSAMPTNLYGPGDQYHPENSHVLPALIRRFHLAKLAGDPVVTAWGTGAPRREFMHVDDLADACALLMEQESPPDWINIGSGSEVTIKELVELVAEAVGYPGKIIWDATKPDGTPRKLMDSSKLAALGWQPRYDLKTGIRHAYACFLSETAAHHLREGNRIE
jgi:GDP-L-fucose synthase